MDEGNLEFAREMQKALGDDRFYHVLNRAAEGDPCKVRPFYVALRGSGQGWSELCHGIKLKFKGYWNSMNLGVDFRWPNEGDEGSVRELLSHAAYIVSAEHKQFAFKRPELPANIHARMLLDTQNQWTRKYAESLGRKGE